MKGLEKLVWIALLMALVGCAAHSSVAAPSVTSLVAVSTEAPTATQEPTPTVVPTATQEPTPTVVPTLFYDSDWKNWPVVPSEISYAMKQLFAEGLEKGNDPHRFSKIGDCQNIPLYFLGGLDKADRATIAEGDSSLKETVSWYQDSWSRWPPSVHGGQNIVAVQMENPLMKFKDNGQEECLKGEAYMECEIRVWQPSLAIVSFEELWDGKTDVYAKWYESLIVNLLDHKIVPVLAMTATNEKANRIIADLAVKYQLPVWNLWTPLQPLKDHGIRDGFHLTMWGDIFDFTVVNYPSGWHIRNITALQTLDAIRTLLQVGK